MTHRHRYAQRTRGFTLIELLTSVVITSIMLLLINVLYTQTQDAVSLGIATSDLIHKVRAVSDEVQRASRQMVGPGNDGFLVIINRRYDNVRIASERLGGTADNLRGDILCFIRNNPSSELKPMAPGTTTSFTYSSGNEQAPFVKVWLGHVEHTARTGGISGRLGQEGDSAFGHEWALGLQYLFLRQDDGTGIGIHADHATDSAAVSTYTSGTTIPAGIPLELHMGLTDVAHVSYSDPASTRAVADPTKLIIGDLTTNTGAVLKTGDTPANYAAGAYSLTYAGDGKRLKYNRLPAGNAFESWSIAQMHAGFVYMCASVEITFAGDYDGDATTQIDVDADGRIIWYDGLTAAGTPGAIPVTANGFTTPSGTPTPAEQPIFDDLSGAPRDGASDEGAVIFRHDDTNKWPRLIRIRYRIHDRRGVLEHDNDPAARINLVPGRWFEQIIAVNRN